MAVEKVFSVKVEGVKGSIDALDKLALSITKNREETKRLQGLQKVAFNEMQKGTKGGAEAYEKLTKQVSANQREGKELSRVNTQLNKTLTQQNKEQRATVGSMEALRAKTSQLKQEANTLNRNTAKGKQRFEELRKEIDKNTKEIRDFDRSLSGNNTLVGEYSRGIKGAAKGLGNMALKMGGALVVAVGLKRALSAVTDIVVQFDDAVAELSALAGDTAPEKIKKLNLQAQALGGTTKFTASEVTNLQSELIKLGFTVDEITKATAGITALAAATGEDLAQSAKIAGSTIRAFNLDASEAQRVSDVLATSFTSSALNLSGFETAMRQVAPVAATFGFSLEETTALLGTLADAGFDASQSGTATRNILLNLADANGELAKKLGEPVKSLPELLEGLRKLDAQGINLSQSLELTDRRSVAAFSRFIDGAESTEKLFNKLQDVNGAAKEMADKRLKSLAGQATLLSSAFDGLVLSIDNGDGAFSGFFKSGLSILTLKINEITGLFTSSEVKANRKRLAEEIRFTKSISEATQEQREILLKIIKEGVESENKEERRKYFRQLQLFNEFFDDKSEAEKNAANRLKDQKDEISRESFEKLTKAIEDEQKIITKALEPLTFGTLADEQEKNLAKIRKNLAGLKLPVEKATQELLKLPVALSNVEPPTIDSLVPPDLADPEDVLANADALAASLSSVFNSQSDLRLSTLEKEKQTELNFAGKNEAQKAQITEKFRKEEARIKTEQFKKNRAASVIQAGIETAMGILRTSGNVPLQILAAITGAIQTAAIISAPVPKFAMGGIATDGGNVPQSGGMITGRSHAAGGVKFNMGGGIGEADGKKGEAYIVNTKHSPYIKEMASRLNVMGGGKAFAGNPSKFNHGGIVSAAKPNVSAEISSALQGAINEIRVINVASDTAKVANKDVQIRNITSL